MADIEDVYILVGQLRNRIEELIPVAPADTEPPKRRRLTKDDVLAAHLASLNKAAPEHSSVTLKSNAKGETQVEVTVRTGDTEGIQTAAEAMAEATRLYRNALETFTLAGFAVTDSQGVEEGAQP